MATTLDSPPTVDKTDSNRRVLIFAVILAAAFITIAGRLWYLQVALGDELLLASETNRSRTIRRVAARGQIEDANGRVLATNHTRLAVWVVPEEIKRDPTVLPRLAKLIGTSKKDIEETIEHDRISNFDPVRVASGIPLDQATRIEEERFDMPGVTVSLDPIRFYPDGKLLGHVLGYIGHISENELKARKQLGYRPGDQCGKLGIESAYEDSLRGVDGEVQIEVDARGRMRGEMGGTEPDVGKTVQLNLDIRLQRLATEELSHYASVGKPGAAVALDPTNGRVLALVSVPGYDPNQFIGGISKTDWDALQTNSLKPQINRSVGSAYAPGSVFKLMVAAEALDLGLISTSTSFKCDGVYKVGTWPKHCHKRAGHGYMTLERAIASSCDVYFYRVGQMLGPERLAKCAKRYGFGTKSEIDIASETDGIEKAGSVPDQEWKLKRKLGPWVGGDTVDYAIGQAMLTVTPLQLCRAVAAIGNGGTLYRPQLVRRIISRDDKGASKVAFEAKKAPMGELGITERSREFVLRAMETTVAHGTAGSAQVEGIRVLGKTGTAQMVSNGRLVDNAWFVALAPAENPKIAVCVFVEAAGHGGDIAAPIARKLIARYMNIPLDPKPPVKKAGQANRSTTTNDAEAQQ